MDFKTHNDIDMNLMGTGLVGYVDCSYDKLLKTFGPPQDFDGYKVDAEWSIKFEDDRIATIYNYKNGKNYLGRRGKSVENIHNWHVGGNKKSVIKDIKEILNNSSIRFKNLEKHESIINAPTQDEWDTMLKCIEQYRDMIEKKPEDDPERYINVILNEALEVIPENVINAFK
jgi:hypothetical protein